MKVEFICKFCKKMFRDDHYKERIFCSKKCRSDLAESKRKKCACGCGRTVKNKEHKYYNRDCMYKIKGFAPSEKKEIEGDEFKRCRKCNSKLSHEETMARAVLCNECCKIQTSNVTYN